MVCQFFGEPILAGLSEDMIKTAPLHQYFGHGQNIGLYLDGYQLFCMPTKILASQIFGGACP
jgi:hypothetical protein